MQVLNSSVVRPWKLEQNTSGQASRQALRASRLWKLEQNNMTKKEPFFGLQNVRKSSLAGPIWFNQVGLWCALSGWSRFLVWWCGSTIRRTASSCYLRTIWKCWLLVSISTIALQSRSLSGRHVSSDFFGSCVRGHDEAGLLAFEALQGLPRPARGTHGRSYCRRNRLWGRQHVAGSFARVLPHLQGHPQASASTLADTWITMAAFPDLTLRRCCLAEIAKACNHSSWFKFSSLQYPLENYKLRNMVRFGAILCWGYLSSVNVCNFIDDLGVNDSTEISRLRYHVKTQARRGSSFSQLGLEPNDTGWTAQSLFFSEGRAETQTSQTSQTTSKEFSRFQNVHMQCPFMWKT